VDKTLKVNTEILNVDIHEWFLFYDASFFNNSLDGKVLLEWSERMTQCAGICYLTNQRLSSGQGTFCTVRLSRPLL